MRGFKGCARVLTIWLAAAAGAMGQGSSTSLQGTITDPTGSAVANASIVLSNAESKIERTATSDARGEYRLLALPPGDYKLSVNSPGFSPYIQTGLQLLVNTPATVNVQLKVGGRNESITITGEPPALNMVDASIGNPFDETHVRQLPLDGRNVPDLLSLQSGVAYTGNRPDMAAHTTYADQDTRNGAVNGARSDQSNVTLDGVNVNDEAKGYAFTSVLPVTPDSVEEFRVTTSNYNADQGDGSGAQVALITKSGTNHLHGSLYEYHRNTLTSANDWFNKAAQVESNQPNKPLKLIRNVFGGSLGGPVKKNRAFFFLNYEGTRQREEHSVLRNIPTPSFMDGVIQYQCAPDASGSSTGTCPASGSVNGLSKSWAYSPGFYAMGPTQIKSFDPGGPQDGTGPTITGPNTVLLNNYFIPTYGAFTANDSSVGDGLNYSGFRFRSPVSYDNNAFIARFDYHLTADGKHTLFWRGSLQNVYNPQDQFLPGTVPEHIVADHSKGFAVGYTAVLNARTVNTFRYGFTRQSLGDLGNSTQEWNQFYTLDQGYTYTDNFQLPVHNLVDDFSWTKGSHTLQVGGNLGFARNPRLSYQHSFYEGLGATFWMAPVGFSNTGGESLLDPLYCTTACTNYTSGAPEPASSTQYDLPMLGLLGMVSDVKANVNYDKLGNTIQEGQPISRHYGLNWYEFYGQDVWRVRPNLTLTYGLRWSLFPPPWEVNGLQASPTFNLGNYFNQNVQNMKNGLGYADGPLISFILGGKANNGPDFFHFEKTDFSPRFSIAYSPRPHGGVLRKLFGENDATVIRAGFSRVYDRAGLQMLSTFDAEAPGGLAATIQNPCCTANTTASTVARVTDPNKVPVNWLLPQIGGSLPVGTFPQTPCAACEAITWNVDQSLKTPNSYAVDFSIGRQLPGKFSLQVAYVGRFGRNLLTQRDLSQPLDLVDKSSGIDYYTAATELSQLARAGTPYQSVTSATVKTAAYWQHMIGVLTAPGQKFVPGLASGQQFVVPTGQIVGGSAVYYNTSDVTQAEYSLFTTSGAYAGDEVVGLANTDLYYYLSDTAANYYFFNGKVGELLNNQMTSMYGWSSIGNSNYNALQATLKKQTSYGVQFDLNYTYSKSIDITSSASRLGFSGSDNIGAPGSRLPNAFYPNAFRAVSDFDATHQFNANWIAELPFGKGKPFADKASGAAQAIIGGWQLSGLMRWNTGFPFTVDNGQFWPTDWDEQGSALQIGHPKTGAFVQTNGHVSAFQNPAAVQANNFFHPFPGGSGTRNGVRGQGFAGWDMALGKRWMMPIEGHSLQFRWEVFNVPNLHRFNAIAGLGDGAPSLQEIPQNFGVYTGLLTQPRVMQFALRYEF